MTDGWAKPSFAKRWHFFFNDVSLCEYHEYPLHVRERPPQSAINDALICERCLLIHAMMNIEKLLGPAPTR